MTDFFPRFLLVIKERFKKEIAVHNKLLLGLKSDLILKKCFGVSLLNIIILFALLKKI